MWHECRIWRAKLDTNRPFELTGLLGRIIFKQTFRKRQDERSHMKLFNTVVPSLSDPNLLPSHNPSIKIPNLKDSKPLVSVQWHHPFGGGEDRRNSRRLRVNVSPESLYQPTNRHGVMSQSTAIR